eukprot:gnl/TRDRNA2_/TRDRNA2_49962_c0_seq1.p1 gnl/TRDRNA2_/TRDRNA2_49962_c0~~gnl/TRDRNA2_/TRDRNA2_49962_c0_seq1.p1  ORF type:complete len:220 (-),score=33.05 gnl/TRDRNA2_/TRDRNA2_49962_c0_seq1:211-870(-)
MVKASGETSAADRSECTLKLFLLGDSAVGKSSLLLRFCERTFDTNFVLTIGVDFKSKRVERNGMKTNVQIWDTAGHERFRTITPAYYRSAHGVAIAYDISDRSTFTHVEFWMEQLAKHGNLAVQKILVGNKCDLEEVREVSREEGKALAARYGVAFFETSAKTGEAVDEAILNLADLVVEQRSESFPSRTASGFDDKIMKKPDAVKLRISGCRKSSCVC